MMMERISWQDGLLHMVQLQLSMLSWKCLDTWTETGEMSPALVSMFLLTVANG